jgi:penicillin-binding protein-related factor A (putative recombinase)
MKLKESEKDIQKIILDDLSYRGAVEIKFNNVGIRKADGKYIPPRQLGVPDILACYKGRFIAIEVKSTGKKPTEHQQAFLNRITEAKGYAFWVDSVDQYFTAMRTIEKGLQYLI